MKGMIEKLEDETLKKFDDEKEVSFEMLNGRNQFCFVDEKHDVLVTIIKMLFKH